MTEALDFGTWDFVVIGAGTAGCVLANRLSRDPATRVLVLEAGGEDDYVWIHIPVGYLYCMGNPRTDWGYSTAPEAGLNGRVLAYPRGRVLGGCSSINGMIYMRGQSLDYDLWRQQGNVGWGWDDVLPYFRRSEHHHARADEIHGQGGEWRVERQRLHWPILDAVRDAALELGIPKVDDFNGGDNEGSAYFEVNQRRGVRWNTTKAFLDPVRRRPNLRVLTGAMVERLTLAGRRVTGVRFHHSGGVHEAGVGAEAILASGAIGTPQLLELSGIGDPEVLAPLGLPVQHRLPGVGKNLQDHLQIRTVFKVKGAATLNERAAHWWGKAGIAAEYALRRSGPMAMAPSQLGIFTRSDPELATPNLEYHVQPLSLERFGEPLHPFPAITVSVCNLRPESRGHVHVTSADPAAHPTIAPNYLATDGDRRIAAQSIRHARRLMATRRLAVHAPEELKPGAAIASDAELARAAGDIATTIFHPVGTAKMGSDPMAVVDDRLRVHGLGALRVVDASIMPTIVSGNTASPVIMIAEKAVDLIRADAGRD